MTGFKTDHRDLRARIFADTIIGVMQDFLPRNNQCLREAHNHLYQLAYEQNAQIISIPPEMDKLTKLQLENAMLEQAINIVIPKDEQL